MTIDGSVIQHTGPWLNDRRFADIFKHIFLKQKTNFDSNFNDDCY